MAVGPFITHDANFATLLSTDNWVSDDHYAVLAISGTAPDPTWTEKSQIVGIKTPGGDYAHINLTGESVSVSSTKVKFDCDKITFTAAGSITARYLYILKGTVAATASTDKIIGAISLDGTGDVSSVSAEFSFDPSASNGLFEVARSAAA